MPPELPTWSHGCFGRRRARPLCVPVGGGPPASRPRRELRSARRLEARPGPATAHRHRGSSLRRPPHQWGWVADRGSAHRFEARPGPAGHAAASNRAELGARVLALASPPPTGTAAAPSGALHTSGALPLTCGRGVVSKLVPAPLSLTVARCRRCVASPDACASPPSMPGH